MNELCSNITSLQQVEYKVCSLGCSLPNLFYKIIIESLVYLGDWNMFKFNGSEKCLGNFH